MAAGRCRQHDSLPAVVGIAHFGRWQPTAVNGWIDRDRSLVDPVISGHHTSMWQQRIMNLTDTASFADPVSHADIADAERALGGQLPRPLVELLSETDGVAGEHGLGLVWPLARIVSDNLQFRTNSDFRDLYMPFDPLLFFADAGNGDQFAFGWTPRRDEIFVWDHENDSRTWVAGSLDQYLEWWLDGTLRL